MKDQAPEKFTVDSPGEEPCPQEEQGAVSMYLSLLLALRFLKSVNAERSLSTMVRICFISIMIGTGSLALIAAIMNGFETATYKKLQGVHADLIIETDEGSIDYPKLKKVLATYPDIVASSPSSLHHVMLQVRSSNEQSENTTICLLKAVDPTTEPLISNIGTMITKGGSSPWGRLKNNHIFLGQTLADRLGVTIGSEVTLLYRPEESSSTRLKKQNVTVVGLYKTGIHDYDEQILIAPFHLANRLYEERITHVALALDKNTDACTIQKDLSNKLSLQVNSWKDLYPSLVSALTLEKYAMWIILLLVTLVAGLTIISLLYMYTTHKRSDIALLKAMGMRDYQLRQMLLWIAGLITLCATTCGIILAAGGTWLLATYPFIPLPDVYFVSHLPASLTGSIILTVYLIALVVSLCAGLFPNSTIKTMRIAPLLKGLI